MKISVLGAGYVGLVTATCLAHHGHVVACCDVDTAKVQRLRLGQIPFYEKDLSEMVCSAVQNGTLSFSDTLEDVMCADTEAVFLAVPTPQSLDGHADLHFVETAVDQLIGHFQKHPMTQDCVVVTKSTVSVGTTARLATKIADAGLTRIFMANNPEFLREGTAVSDFMNPDRIVVGADFEEVLAKMISVYQPFLDRGVPLISVGYAASELIKYASNTFLATKVAFINEMAVLSESVGATVQDIAKGMGLDPRIGAAFLSAGPGYGGSCFPKDVSALGAIVGDNGLSLPLVGAVSVSNEAHKAWVFQKIMRVLSGVSGKRIAVLGLAFKANTDDIRDSVAISIAQQLVAEGAAVTVFDPEAMSNSQAVLGDNVRYAATVYDAVTEAQGCLVLTEWPLFCDLDLRRVYHLMADPLVIDMRCLWDRHTMSGLGFSYFPLGTAV
jgi:UDPglucose 6-dehydrogenase